jgi:hypothetical protein
MERKESWTGEDGDSASAELEGSGEGGEDAIGDCVGTKAVAVGVNTEAATGGVKTSAAVGRSDSSTGGKAV